MTITIQEAQEAMRINFEANLPVMLKGASGIGKTEISLAYAEAQGEDYGIFELNAATANLPDVIGVLMPHEEVHVDAEGNERRITCGRYAYPYFMRDKRTGRPAFTFSRGLVVIEEYGQATPDVKRGLASVIWEKRVGEHRFPAKTDILLLSNRAEDRSGVSKDFDFLINRRNELEVRADLNGWLVWAHGEGISNTALAFASRNEDKVFANKAPEKQGPWLTPRSLVSIDRFVEKALKAGHKLDDPFIRENISGLGGEGNAHVYIAFAKIRDQLPSITAILADPSGCKVPEEPDQAMFLVFDLASKVTRENIKKVVEYMRRMPDDFAIAFYRSAMRRDESLRSTKEFGDWAVDNTALLSAVARP